MLGSRDGVWDCNFLTEEWYLSDSWKDMLGYASDELMMTSVPGGAWST